jgi:hypothetical protein
MIEVEILDITECFSGNLLIHHGVTTVHRVRRFRIIMATTTRGESELWFVL